MDNFAAVARICFATALAAFAVDARAEFIFYPTRNAWIADVGNYRDVDLSKAEHTANGYVSSFSLPFPWTGAVAYLNYPAKLRQVTEADGWPEPTHVLQTDSGYGQLKLTFDFTPCEYDPVTCNRDVSSAPPRGLGAFGLEMQLVDGEGGWVEAGITLRTASNKIVGDYRSASNTPAFFGWKGDEPVRWLEVSCEMNCNFAIGRMVQDVPEPATLPLLGAGLLGVMYGRRRAQGERGTVVVEIDSAPDAKVS